MRTIQHGDLRLPSNRVAKTLNSPIRVPVGDYYQMGRWNSEHVSDNAVDVIVSKAVTERYHRGIWATQGSRKVSEEFCVREIQRFHIFCRGRIDNRGLERSCWDIGVRFVRSKWNSVSSKLAMLPPPVQGTMKLGEANYTLHVSRFAPDSR